MKVIVNHRVTGKTQLLVEWFAEDPAHRYVAVQNQTLRFDFIERFLRYGNMIESVFAGSPLRNVINVGGGRQSLLYGLNGASLAIDDVDIFVDKQYDYDGADEKWIYSIIYETIARTGIPNIAVMTATGPPELSRM